MDLFFNRKSYPVIIFFLLFHTVFTAQGSGLKPVPGKTVFMQPVQNSFPPFFSRKYPQVNQRPQIVDHLLFNGGDTEILHHNGATPLMEAAAKGASAETQKLINEGAVVDAITDTGITALMLAAKYGHLDVVQLLVSAGANINLRSKGPLPDLPPLKGDISVMQTIALMPFKTASERYQGGRNGFTPLGLAIANGHKDVAVFLVSNGADVNLKGFGASPLAISLYCGYPDTALYLIGKGASMKSTALILGETVDLLTLSLDKEYPDVAEFIIDHGAIDMDASVNTPYSLPLVHYCSAVGNTASVEFLSRKGADINQFDRYGMTPVLYTALYGNKKILEILLAFGADVDVSCDLSDNNANICPFSGATPLLLSVKRKDYGTAEFLLNHGADIYAADRQGRQAVTHAVINGDICMLDFLLNKGADIHAVDFYEDSLMVTAARMCLPPFDFDKGMKIMNYLISRGADVNMRNQEDKNALDIAIDAGVPGMASLLIDKNADLGHADASGMTPLLKAIAKKEEEIAGALIQGGADPDRKDLSGRTPLHYAVSNNLIDTAVLLIDKGGDVNAKDRNGGTALMKASAKGNLKLVQKLVENGAEINAKDNDGYTAYIASVLSGREDVSRYLKEKGSDTGLGQWGYRRDRKSGESF